MSLWEILLQHAGLIPAPPVVTQSEFRAREVIPDRISTEPIVGFRSWYVSRTLQGLRLMGFANHVWESEETAECLPFVGPACGGVVPNPHHSCGIYCVEASTPVLTHDLRWEAAGNLRVGDRLYAVEEDGPLRSPFTRTYGKGKEERLVEAPGRRSRRYEESFVTANEVVDAPVVRVELEDGQSITCTPNHPLLARTPTRQQRRAFSWVEASELTPDYELPQFMDVWESDVSWEAGWLAGMYDGEGYLGASSKRHVAPGSLGIAQREGDVLEQIYKVLRDRKFDWGVHGGGGTNSDVANVRIRGGYSEVLRLLGSVRPARLIAKIGYPELRPMRHVRVRRVIDAGVQPIAMMSTTSKTYITKGFASHNSQLPDQPLEEWQSQLHGRVVASGTVRLSGTVVVCQMGYRAQYAAINEPVVLDMTCTGVIGPFGAASGCDNPPVRVSFAPVTPGARNQIVAWCLEGTHVPPSTTKHTLEATPWIKEAARELSDAYGLEVLTWSDL